VEWSDVDLPVLKWVFEASALEDAETGDLRDSDDESPVAGVSQRDLIASLRRLHGHGLIAGEDAASFQTETWFKLRPTADGLRVLGEWPPKRAADVNRTIALILQRLADEAEDPEEAKVYRRGAGAVARFGGSVLADVAKAELGHLGGEIAG
jgi:hypothetical protein